MISLFFAKIYMNLAGFAFFSVVFLQTTLVAIGQFVAF